MRSGGSGRRQAAGGRLQETQMADSTAMTIDFLRARLLSERSVSRAAKERADQLANRVVELEEQLRTATAQRKAAERAAAEVLSILEVQGFGHLSDVIDSSSDQEGDDPDYAKSGADDDVARGDGASGRGEVEDALSGSELGGSAPQAGGLSWKGRGVSAESEKKHKGKQFRPKHRRSYFYLVSADSSPKYQRGQSCRKIKRKELRSAREDEEGKVTGVESPKGQDISDCTDDQPDLDGEVSKDTSVEDGGDRYDIKYEKDGEMERVLERQAELIGQYEAEENAQREWEKQFNNNRNSTPGDVQLENKLYQIENGCEQIEVMEKGTQLVDQEVHYHEEAKLMDKSLPSISITSAEGLLNCAISEPPHSAPECSTAAQRELKEADRGCAQEADCGFAQTTSTICSFNGELQSRKDEWVNQSYGEIVEGSGHDIGRSATSAQGRSSPVARHNGSQGDEHSDSGSSYNANARSSEHYIISTPSVGSPFSDTHNSKISEGSASSFQNQTDNQLDIQLYQPSSDLVGGVLEALQHAKMSLRQKLSRPSLPSREILALPAPEDYHTRVDLPANDAKNLFKEELSRSSPPRQEILALPAPGDDHRRTDLVLADTKIPVGLAGLFRLPTDSFPKNQMCSSDAFDSGFSWTATSRQTAFSSSPANHVMATPLILGAGSGFSPKQYYDPQSSALLSMPTFGRYSIPTSDFTIGGNSFLRGTPVPKDFRMPPGDSDMFLQRGGDYTISNKWMM